jgi:hypothetical protein
MADNIIPFPHTNGSNGSAQVRVVPYPAQARVIVEHHDHPSMPGTRSYGSCRRFKT